jgi:hypothetical protein
LLLHAPAHEEEDEGEGEGGPSRIGWLLRVPAVVLLAAGFAVAFLPGIAGQAVHHAQRFEDRPAIARETLHAVAPPTAQPPHVSLGAGAYAYGIASAVGAVALALGSLYRRRFPSAFEASAERIGIPLVRRLRHVHDGVTGDYVTWLCAGTAAIGGLLAVLIR